MEESGTGFAVMTPGYAINLRKGSTVRVGDHTYLGNHLREKEILLAEDPERTGGPRPSVEFKYVDPLTENVIRADCCWFVMPESGPSEEQRFGSYF